MKKRGQIAIFILLGIILLIAIALIFFINREQTEEQIPSTVTEGLSTEAIQLFVQGCITSVGEDALIHVGKRGGYYELPEIATEDTAYYYLQNQNLMLSQTNLEEEVGHYIDERLPQCLQDFTQFKAQGFAIEPSKSKTTTTIRPNNVRFAVDFPLKITKGTTTNEITSFITAIDAVRLKTIYEVVASLTTFQINEPSICISCMVDEAIDNEIQFDLKRVGEYDIQFTVIDEKSIVKENPYEYSYVYRFDAVSCTSIPDYMPEENKLQLVRDCLQQRVNQLTEPLAITSDTVLQAKVGIETQYVVQATGKDIEFFDYSNMFDIAPVSGIIRFTPAASRAGNHSEVVGIRNKEGKTFYTTIQIEVLP